MLHWDIENSGPIRFASSGRYITQKPSVHPRRNLSSFGLLVGVEGECRIAQDGREYALGPGDYMLLLPGHEHYGTAPTTGTQSHYWCHFYASDAGIDETENGLAEFGHLPDPGKYDILFRQLTDAEYKKYANDALRQRICDAYTTVILGELANDMAQVHSEEGRLIVSSVKEWIKLRSSEAISPAMVAEQFGYHPDYLTSVFRRATGKTVCAYIKEVRIGKAKKLLITTDMKIGQIAAAVGFADEKYFMRVFRRSEGITPTEYRNVRFNLHVNGE